MSSPHETQRQLQIVKQVREAGGYGRKQTNAYTSGIPDLHLIVPGYAPFDVEVKDLKEVGLKFRRKIELTRLQAETMRAMNAVTDLGDGFAYEQPAIFAFTMITYHRGRKIYVAWAPAHATHVTQETPCATLSDLSRQWPLILQQMGVPKL